MCGCISCFLICNKRKKSPKEDQNTHLMLNNSFFENHAVYGIMWKKFVKPDKPQISIQCIRIAFCISKDNNTHPEYSTYCFSTATMVARSRLDVTSHILCLLVSERYNCIRILNTLKNMQSSLNFYMYPGYLWSYPRLFIYSMTVNYISQILTDNLYV